MRRAIAILSFVVIGGGASDVWAANCPNGQCHNASGACVAVSASACAPKQDTYVCVDCTATAGPCRTAACSTPGYTCSYTNLANGTSCGTNMTCDGNGVCKCNGCVDSSGACQPGNTAALCGTAGAACKVCTDCASGGSCTAGVCSGGTATNEGGSCWSGTGTCHAGGCCTTCWNGTSCVGSTSSTSCGAAGGPCRNCNDCRTGTTSCNAGTCTGGTVGGDGTSCSAGAGICHSGNCCTGCWDGTQCRTISGDACGVAGGACTNCNTCKTGTTCSAGACTGGTNVTDNSTCSGTPGTCHAGACCSGCWDGAACQAGSVVTACGGAGQSCKNCNDCKSGAACTGGACTGGTNLSDGTVCQTTYACCQGTCNTSGAACCFGANMCLNSLGACVAGNLTNQCGTNGAACQDCTGSNECGNTASCSAGACVTASDTSPPSACQPSFAQSPPQTSVQCDYASANHCTTFARDVSTADCRGKLTHNAYPGGFAPEDFLVKTNVAITAGSISPTGASSPAGSVVSRNLSREISTWASDEQQWMLSRVHVKFTGTRVGTCGADDYVALYVSIDETSYQGGGTVVKPVPIQITPRPDATEGVLPFLVQTSTTSGGFAVEQVYDLFTWGHKGTRLRWQADFYKASSGCTLALTEVDVGYQAMLNDYTNSTDNVYKLRSYSSLIPLANMMYFGALETPGAASEWPGASGGDLAPRGHLIAESYYDPANPTATNPPITKQWDAGEELNSQQPRYRRLFSSDSGGARMDVTTANSTLPQLVLPGYERSATDASGNLIHDFNHDGVVNDADATEVINWTRGCALGSSTTCGGSSPTLRPWLLGAIDRSTPAIVGPPNMPWWLNGQKIPAQLRSDYWTWAGNSARASRDTMVYIGSQDGMIHGFYGGKYLLGDDPTTDPIERRGYFYRADASSPRDYGGRSMCLTRHGSSGDNTYPQACPERFGYVPRTLLGNLRNNVTARSGKPWTFLPASHPRTVIESSPMVEDVTHYNTGTSTWEFRTTLFSGIGPISPYLIALDVTDPNEPQPLWERTYANFRGTLKAPPSAAFAHVPVSGTNVDRQVLLMTSGFGWNLWDPYMLVIDAWTGDEIVPGGVQLNPGGRPPSYGTFGSPLLLDMEGDGYVDRAYVLDTGRDSSGNLFTRVVRVSIRPTLDNTSPPNPQVCEVFYASGEGAFGGLAGYVCDPSDPTAPCTTPKVRLYFGTSDDPRWDDQVSGSQYHLYAIDDTDVEPPDSQPEVNPSCTAGNHTLQFRYDLDTGGSFPEKTWLTPAIDYQYVYFATLKSPTDSECDWDSSLAGRLLKFDLDGNGLVKSSQTLTVQPVGQIRVYDQHVFMGTSSGTPTITAPSGTGFNNIPQGIAAQSKVRDDYWIEQ